MNYYNEIKNELVNNEINKRVKDYSKNVGKLLSEAGKHYGESIIKKYSKKLTSELGKGYTTTNLKLMRQFLAFSKSHTVCDLLTWSHYRTLLTLRDDNKVNFYTKIIIEQNLSVRQLREKIKNKEYERLDNTTKVKLITKEETTLVDLIKNPIVIKNNNNREIISEKALQQLILENLPAFLKELGNGFTFVENEYKIKIGNTYNYIDLLLYNYEYNCFVVAELKVTELKKNILAK